MEGRYNTRSPAVKRLMREAQELSEPTDQYYAQPLEDNLFEWHFTVRGPADSDFEGGIYHGRIVLPVDYPMKPPSIIWLTPNGRFETNKKICLSISGHHPESWQPSWSIRTALLAIIGFMPTHPGGAIGSLDYKPEERKVLAKKSRDWKCPTCGEVTHILLDVSSEPSQTSQEAKELASQIAFQGEKPTCKEGECPIEKAATSSPPVAPSTSEPQGTSNNSSVNASTSISQTVLPASVPHKPFQFLPPGSDQSMAMPGAYPFPNPYQPFLPSPWGLPGIADSNRERDIASMVPRFPYPPSHYPGGYSVPFYPPGLAPPRGVGMFPCPYPPPPSPRGTRASWSPPVAQNPPSPISVNNSSATSANAGQVSAPKTDSPMASPVLRNPPTTPASGGATENNMPNSPPSSPIRMNVLNELLAKVKRIGSNEVVQQGSSVEVGQQGSSVDEAPNTFTDPSYISQMSISTTEVFPTTVVSSFKIDEDTRTTSEAYSCNHLLSSQTMSIVTSSLPVMERSQVFTQVTKSEPLPVIEAAHVFSDVTESDTSPAMESSHVFSHITHAEGSTSNMGDKPQSAMENIAIQRTFTAPENMKTEDKEDKVQMRQLKPPDIIPASQSAAAADEAQLLSTISEARETEKSSSTISEQKKRVSSEDGATEEKKVHKSQVVEREVESTDKPEVAKDSSGVDNSAGKKQESSAHEVTDKELSHSLKKKDSVNEQTGMEMSQSELLLDADENSEAAAPPIEVSDTEQRSNFEKSTSSSMSDLQKMRKHENAKTLRQRQSATARVPQEMGEDNESQEISTSAPGHRIEAASGDTTSRNRLLRPGVRVLNDARLVHREALAQVRQRHSPYDASFLLMVGLFVATVFIILNRVFNTLDWSDVFFSEFY